MKTDEELEAQIDAEIDETAEMLERTLKENPKRFFRGLAAAIRTIDSIVGVLEKDYQKRKKDGK